MTQHFDAIVVGAGGVGSAAASISPNGPPTSPLGTFPVFFAHMMNGSYGEMPYGIPHEDTRDCDRGGLFWAWLQVHNADGQNAGGFSHRR